MSLEIIDLQNGVEGLFIKNNRFNTTLISYKLYSARHFIYFLSSAKKRDGCCKCVATFYAYLLQ